MAVNTHIMIPPALNIPQFAEYLETIKMLYRIDDDFKTLCDDYVTSNMNVEKFRGLAREGMKNESEYKQLSLDLEKEILDYVIKRS